MQQPRVTPPLELPTVPGSPPCPAGPGTLQLMLPRLQPLLGLPVPSSCCFLVVPQCLRQVLLHTPALLVANAHVEPALGMLARPPAQGRKHRVFNTFFRVYRSLVTFLSLPLHPSVCIFSNLVPWREAQSLALLLPIPFQLNSLISLQHPGLCQGNKGAAGSAELPSCRRGQS